MVLYNESNQLIIENENDYKVINLKTINSINNNNNNNTYQIKDKTYRIRKDLYFRCIRILFGFLTCFSIFLFSIYGRYLV